MTCPLMYRFRTIDKLPEQPSPDAVRGTVVHKVLEDLFDLPAAERTPDVAADMLVPSWEALLEAAPEVAEMFGEEGPDVASWLTSCREVLDRYFTLEDPRRLEPAERELYVETVLDSKLLLRGFVDRLDVAPDGRVRVVDYKGLVARHPASHPLRLEHHGGHRRGRLRHRQQWPARHRGRQVGGSSTGPATA